MTNRLLRAAEMKPTHQNSTAHLISPADKPALSRNLALSTGKRALGFRLGRTALVLFTSVLICGHAAIQGARQTTALESTQSVNAPKCSTSGTDDITITCTYSSAPRPGSEPADRVRIILNHAVISFDPTEEEPLYLELTFTKEPADGRLAARPVYFEIDDDRDHNYIRRLTKVDLAALTTTAPHTFSEKMQAPIFPIGHFIIYLWIPDPDPALRFDHLHNFLLSNVGVPDSPRGLNRLADFTVTKSKPRMQRR